MAKKVNTLLLALRNNLLLLTGIVLGLNLVLQMAGMNVLIVLIADVLMMVVLWRTVMQVEDSSEPSEVEDDFHVLRESVEKLAEASSAVSNGEVGARMPEDLEGDLCIIADNISSIIEATVHIIKEIDDMSEGSATTSRSLEDISTSTAKVMNDLSATLQELTSTTMQINNSVEEISEGANEIDSLTRDGMDQLSDLEVKMGLIKSDSDKASKRIMALNQSAQEMDNIIEVITGIAKQTNLLALNAAIEAARAGEAGKGFAVVADEVRKLAASTQSSLEDIKALIDEFTKESKQAVDIINANNDEIEAGSGVLAGTTKTFKVIAKRISEMVDQVKESSMATAQIASGSQEIASAAGVQSESIEQIHELSKQLATMSSEMKDSLSEIQIGGSELELDLKAFDSEYSRISHDEKQALKKEFKLDGDFTVGMIARLEPNKGHDFFFEGLTHVLDKHPKVNVVVAGNGSLEYSLQAKVERMGLAHRVKMVGYRSDIIKILSILDLVVGTSIKEGTPPRILLEAMAARKPIVSTDVAGAKAIIKQAKHGLLVKHGDTKGLSEAISKMVEKPEVAKSLAGQARAHIEKLDGQR